VTDLDFENVLEDKAHIHPAATTEEHAQIQGVEGLVVVGPETIACGGIDASAVVPVCKLMV